MIFHLEVVDLTTNGTVQLCNKKGGRPRCQPPAVAQTPFRLGEIRFFTAKHIVSNSRVFHYKILPEIQDDLRHLTGTDPPVGWYRMVGWDPKPLRTSNPWPSSSLFTMAGLQTPLTQLLGIQHPIMLAGMNGVSHSDLAAAVSNAGQGSTWIRSSKLSDIYLDIWHIPQEMEKTLQEIQCATPWHSFGELSLPIDTLWPQNMVELCVLPAPTTAATPATS